MQDHQSLQAENSKPIRVNTPPLKYIDRTPIYIDEIVSIASTLHRVEAKHMEYCFRKSTVLKPNYELDYIIRNFKVEIGED